MRKRIVFFRRRAAWQTGRTMSGVPAFVALTFLAHWLGLVRQHGVVRSVRFSFPCGFRVGSGDSDFPGTAIVLRGVATWVIIPEISPGPPGWDGCPRNSRCIFAFRASDGLIEQLPLYGDIRAPHDFCGWAAYFCFSVAAGLRRDDLASAKCRGAALGLRTAAALPRAGFHGLCERGDLF